MEKLLTWLKDVRIEKLCSAKVNYHDKGTVNRLDAQVVVLDAVIQKVEERLGETK